MLPMHDIAGIFHQPADHAVELLWDSPALLATPFFYHMARMSEEMSQAHTREPFHSTIPTSRHGELRAASGPRLLASDQLCEELYQAVVSAASRRADSMEALRATVRRFTLALRNEGAKPEAVLIALKEIINSRVFQVEVSPSPAGSPERLRQQISAWSIQDYFSNQQS